MPNPYEVSSIPAALEILAWAMVVIGAVRIVFGTFLTQELLMRVIWRDDRRNRLKQLSWELEKGLHWNAELAAGSPHAARRELTPDDFKLKDAERKKLAQMTTFERAMSYGATCYFCQCAWMALAIKLLSGEANTFGSVIASMLCYAVLAVALATNLGLFGSPPPPAAVRNAPRTGSSCRG